MTAVNLRPLLRVVKPLLSLTLYRPGTVVTILRGPSRGLRYRVFPGFGLAPIYGGWEPEAQRLMVQHIHAGDVVYDLGANRGIHTLLFSRLVGNAGHVHAFEPLPDIISELKANVALNGFTNVTPWPYAVAAHAGFSGYTRAHHSGAGHLVTGRSDASELQVETVSIDEVVLTQGQRPPTFIKIDIEGAEGAALAGATRVLEQAFPTLLIDLHTPDQDVMVGKVLVDLGYVAFRTNAPNRRIPNLRSGWPDPDGLWGQIIAVPPLR